MPAPFPQDILLPNSYLEFRRTNGQTPPVAPTGSARLTMGAAGQLLLSVAGSAYGEVESSGAGGDTLTIGADVTLTRTGADALGITESVTLTSPAAASTPLTIAAVTSQSGDLVTIKDAVPTNRIRVTSAGLLLLIGTGTVTQTGLNTYGLTVRVNATSEVDLISLRQFAAAGTARIQMQGDGTPNGYIVMGGSTTSSPASLVRDKIGIVGATNTSIVFYTVTSGQTIQMYPGGTTVKYTFDTAALTLGDPVDFVFGTTTGTKLGTVGGAAGQKIGAFGATPITQPVVATGSTTDQVITALQNLGWFRQS